MKRYAAFTDCDLDGIGSYLTFKWFNEDKNIAHEICSKSNFRRTFTGWLARNRIEDYEKVYIFDLDVSQDDLDIVDRDNIVIIDHHDTHIANQHKYKKAKTILVDTTSCCKLIYTLFKAKFPDVEISDSKKLLVLMVDDYDSYKLEVPNSYNLNVVLWNYAGKRAEQFSRDFSEGFKEFNEAHLNMINFNKRKVDRIISELEVYAGELAINKKTYNLYATTTDSVINEVAHHVIENYKCDICIVMNIGTGRASFRKNKETAPDVDLGKLASKIADGGGHAYSAGGKVTEKLLTLTKILKPVRTV